MLAERAGLRTEEFAIIPFPIEFPEKLPNYLPTSIPCLTTVYDDWNREKVRVLESRGYEVVVLYERTTKGVSGEVIREAIRSGRCDWRDIVPKATVRAVEELDLATRLTRLVDRVQSPGGSDRAAPGGGSARLPVP